jgi:hypothetical protein
MNLNNEILQLLCSRHYCPANISQLNCSDSKIQSQSCFTTDGQSAILSWCQASIWGSRRDFYYRQTLAGLSMWGGLSGERTGLPFTIAAGPRQRSDSRVGVPRDSWPYFTISDSRLPQPGGPGPRICMAQERGCQIIPPRTGLPLRRPLRLVGLRWGYSNQPPRGEITHSLNCRVNCPQNNSPARTTQKTQPICSCRGVFIAPLHSNCRGADHIKNTVLLLSCAWMLRALLATAAV